MCSKPLSAIVVATVALAGCGSSEKPARAVRLTIDAPGDMALLHQDSVEVHGVVSPATAQVRVEGRNVPVGSGRFSATVALRPGTNLIDVQAGAPGGARPAMAAVRVRREVTVSIPDLTGYTPSDAKDALAGLGLKAVIHKSSGLFDFLIPNDARVCQTNPPAGIQVDPGTTVNVFAAKSC